MSCLQWLFTIFMCLLIGCAIHSVDEEAQLLEIEVPPRFSLDWLGRCLMRASAAVK